MECCAIHLKTEPLLKKMVKSKSLTVNELLKKSYDGFLSKHKHKKVELGDSVFVEIADSYSYNGNKKCSSSRLCRCS